MIPCMMLVLFYFLVVVVEASSNPSSSKRFVGSFVGPTPSLWSSSRQIPNNLLPIHACTVHSKITVHNAQRKRSHAFVSMTLNNKREEVVPIPSSPNQRPSNKSIRNTQGNKSSNTGRSKSSSTKKKDALNTQLETWRFYGISTHPDDDDWYELEETKRPTVKQTRHAPVPKALREALSKKLKLEDMTTTTRTDAVESTIQGLSLPITVVRRSLDARRKLAHPTFQYVVDVVLTPSQIKHARLKQKPGLVERIIPTDSAVPKTDDGSPVDTTNRSTTSTTTVRSAPYSSDDSVPRKRKRVAIIGAGPAGLFCALQLALSNQGVEPILFERGQPVEKRGRDIGALMHRTQLNPESNFAFGEGGAGTWSDGKLTTRIGRNSANVRWILETLVEYGAPANILWEGAPHLGTDNLVRLLRNMRHDLEERLGTTIHFGTRLTNIQMDPNRPGVVQGIHVERTNKDGSKVSDIIAADAVVLATGHSARDVYETLAAENIACLEPKGFAVGFRIEHPQKLITKIQYGNEWGLSVRTGKRQTDVANEDFFALEEKGEDHLGKLPVPSYRLATDKANDGTSSDRLRGVYSFCMCPGGQIVPASTNSSEICVNGMSFSKRDSQWANSALVVTVFPDDPILEPYREKFGILAGLEFQRSMERRAAEMGGGDLTVPVQRVTDFIAGKVSETIPSSSYRLGVKSSSCHDIYPAPITEALRDALTNHFDGQMPGYVHPDGLLHAVETRTSSPLRIARDNETYQAKGCANLFPAGEGAGFAGGIVSAAVDGRSVAEAVLDYLYGSDREGRLSQESSGRHDAIGFSY